VLSDAVVSGHVVSGVIGFTAAAGGHVVATARRALIERRCEALERAALLFARQRSATTAARASRVVDLAAPSVGDRRELVGRRTEAVAQVRRRRAAAARYAQLPELVDDEIGVVSVAVATARARRLEEPIVDTGVESTERNESRLASPLRASALSRRCCSR
jgi:hypothetical protein